MDDFSKLEVLHASDSNLKKPLVGGSVHTFFGRFNSGWTLLSSCLQGSTLFSFYLDFRGRIRATTSQGGSEEQLAIKIEGLLSHDGLQGEARKSAIFRELQPESSFFTKSGPIVIVNPILPGGWGEKIHKHRTFEWCRDSKFVDEKEAQKIADFCNRADQEKKEEEGWRTNTHGGIDGTSGDSRVNHAVQELGKAITRKRGPKKHRRRDVCERLGNGLCALQNIFPREQTEYFACHEQRKEFTKRLTLFYLQAYHDDSELNHTQISSEVIKAIYLENEALLHDALEYAELSRLSYIKRREEIESEMKKELPGSYELWFDSKDVMKGLSIKSSSRYFRAIVAVDSARRRVIVAFRGTHTKRDIFISDRRLWIQDSLPSRVEGRCNKFIEYVFKEIEARYPRYEVIFTGHSLGGALAKIYALHKGKSAIVFDPLDISELKITGDYSRIKNVVFYSSALSASTFVHMGIKKEKKHGAKNYSVRISEDSIIEDFVEFFKSHKIASICRKLKELSQRIGEAKLSLPTVDLERIRKAITASSPETPELDAQLVKESKPPRPGGRG